MLCHLPGIVSSNPYVKVTISRLYISLTTFTVKLWNMLFISKCATFRFDAFILNLSQSYLFKYNKTADRTTGNIYNYTTNYHITDHSEKKITN
jgi:hypothetical protein